MARSDLLPDAQLSQRYRAAGCVSFRQSGRLELGDSILRTLGLWVYIQPL